ncbi:uncharacterized protein BXZ73DRAFT_75776 [Epithele typhae]|uniref:uncharacterized protein n=1 Tax=Epithele typhae TaxID=378194 RepID=UPI002007BACA|nr:uncharacterized protein BXZ73DRAFT_75776 [Epithele typhae]KAH9940179.1 hypothetical protein BXZ73DRAFT_75776 [Epithele typhae]
MIKSYTSRTPELRSVTTWDDWSQGCLYVLLHYLANTSSGTSLENINVTWWAGRAASSRLFATIGTAALTRLLSTVYIFTSSDRHGYLTDISFLSGLKNVRKLSLQFGTSTTLLEIARGLVQGGSPHLVDFTLAVPLDTFTLVTEADLIELADLTSSRPFSSVKNVSFNLDFWDDGFMEEAGPKVLEVLARMWPLISQDAQAVLSVRSTYGCIWRWSREEQDTKTGENWEAEIDTGTSFWQGEVERANAKRGGPGEVGEDGGMDAGKTKIAHTGAGDMTKNMRATVRTRSWAWAKSGWIETKLDEHCTREDSGEANWVDTSRVL